HTEQPRLAERVAVEQIIDALACVEDAGFAALRELARPAHGFGGLCALGVFADSIVEFHDSGQRCEIGVNGRGAGPTYAELGWISRLFARCSAMCATRPQMRAMKNIGANSPIGKPQC